MGFSSGNFLDNVKENLRRVERTGRRVEGQVEASYKRNVGSGEFFHKAGQLSPIYRYVVLPQREKRAGSKAARQRQEQAQAEALNRATSEQRRTRADRRRVNRRTPNVGALIAANAAQGLAGSQSTLLTTLGGSRALGAG